MSINAPGTLISEVFLLIIETEDDLLGVGFRGIIERSLFGLRMDSCSGIIMDDLRCRACTSAIGMSWDIEAVLDKFHSCGGGILGGQNRSSGRMTISGYSADLQESQQGCMTTWNISHTALWREAIFERGCLYYCLVLSLLDVPDALSSLSAASWTCMSSHPKS